MLVLQEAQVFRFEDVSRALEPKKPPWQMIVEEAKVPSLFTARKVARKAETYA